ncbi:uncharacterized protein LOC127597295 isoform X2 [Hippocampus zosterae]|uniref:uncharacterized protein LOC127597295 isoform X2 n=1 Tax=Hippocampus zosterae TaxID=109293 RepID=UPI00223DC874|nr:uncharacterized protein LOC127597295 isoform X2 [Hippocampus zosterae]
MKHTAVCLVALALVVSLCSGYPNVDQEHHDQQQAKHVLERPLSWTYPEGPTVPVEHVPDFELRHPVASKTVSVECGERQARMVVQKDFFGTGQLVKRADLTLGPCGAVGEDTQAQVLIFETELQDCGSMSRMTDDALIYTFVIDYNPKMLSDSPIVRTIVRNIETAVIVECHYPRHHNVSSLPLDPKWIPFSAVRVAEEFLYFTLTLRTDDWMYERPRYQYYLGDMVRIEATVRQYHHVPLRVFVETCTATLSPDMNSNPRYTFLDQGCLVDARITGTESRFMQRTAENMLQFQFEAFKFQGADSGMLYITCHLRATSTSHDIDGDHRACSYMINDWRESSGVDSACANCDAIVGQRQTGGWGTGGGGGSQTGGGNSNTGGGSGTQTGGGGSSSGGGSGGGGSAGGGSGGGGSGGGGSGKQTGVSWISSGSGGTGSTGTSWSTSGGGGGGGGGGSGGSGGAGGGKPPGGTGSTGTFWSPGSGGGNSGGSTWHTSGGGGGSGGSGGAGGGKPLGGTGSTGTFWSTGSGGGNSGGSTWHTSAGGGASGGSSGGGAGSGRQPGSRQPGVSWPSSGSGGTGSTGTFWSTGSDSGNSVGSTWHTSGGGGGSGGSSGAGGGNHPGGKQPGVSWTPSGSGGTGSTGTSSSTGGGVNPGVTTWHTIGVGGGQTGGGQPPKVSWNPRGSGSSGTSSNSWTSTSTGSNTWSGRTGRSVKEHPVYEWAGVVTLGPFEVAEKLA